MEFKKYSFDDRKKVPLEDLNLPIEVRDYVKNLCEVDEVTFERYPKELLERGLILATWCGFDLNDDNIELQTFNLYQQFEYDVFSQGVTFYAVAEEENPAYMVFKYWGDNSTIIVKI
jgi:hypothetical protein